MRYILWSAILTIMFSSIADAESIRVGGTGYWSPYCYTSPEEPSKLQGFTVDFLKEVFNQPGDDLNLTALPWKRCLAMLESHELDLVLDGSKDSLRLQKYLFSNEIYHLDNVLYYLKDRFPNGPNLKSAEDMSRYSLGGIYGFYYKMFPFDVSKVQTGAKDIETMLKKLEKHRFDLAIGFEQIVRSQIRLKGIDTKNMASVPMPRIDSLRFYIFGNHTPKTKRLLQRINSALIEMEADGRLEKLRKKYGLQAVGD